MQSIKGAEISTAGFTDKTTKNNLDLVKWCENAYKNGWGYVYGGYGQVCTKQYLDQQASLFPSNNEAGGEMREVGEKWLGKRVCDCIGLIKSYAWYNADSGKIVAGSNGFTDCGANSIWSSVTESGPISNMSDTPDLLSGWTVTSECISATVKSLKHRAQHTELSKLSLKVEDGLGG